MPDEVAPGRWLLLVHQLPATPSNLRVHIWRRLQQVGAVALRNSIYVLPNNPESREDFEWVRAEIAARGGQVSILAAQAVDGLTDDELEAAFRAARTVDFAALIKDVHALEKHLTAKSARLSRAAMRRAVGKARDRLHALQAIDFFGADRAADARISVEQLERALQPAPAAVGVDDRLNPRFFRRRVWVTRPRPGVDRMASAWLIRRFVAPDAKFVFNAKAIRDHIPFDMPDVEFGHHGSECTYETLLRRFGVTDGAAIRIGQLVHDLDLKESRYGVPEAGTIGRLVDGLRQAGRSDHEMLESGIVVIDALHRSFAADRAADTHQAQRKPSPQTAIKKGLAGEHG
jgi:hypothetical protein